MVASDIQVTPGTSAMAPGLSIMAYSSLEAGFMRVSPNRGESYCTPDNFQTLRIHIGEMWNSIYMSHVSISAVTALVDK